MSTHGANTSTWKWLIQESDDRNSRRSRIRTRIQRISSGQRNRTRTERRPGHPRDEGHGPKYPTIYADLVPSTPIPNVSYTCAAKEEARGELEHERTLADEHTPRETRETSVRRTLSITSLIMQRRSWSFVLSVLGWRHHQCRRDPERTRA
jgi:hypothetical protein